jgi:hypothetical protein
VPGSGSISQGVRHGSANEKPGVGALQDDAATGSVYAYGLNLDPAGAGGALGDLLDALPDGAFSAAGHRTAMQSRLANIQQTIADADAAISQLWNLRRHVDGCGSTADGNDWIVDCAAQLSVRDLIDTMITGLGG